MHVKLEETDQLTPSIFPVGPSCSKGMPGLELSFAGVHFQLENKDSLERNSTDLNSYELVFIGDL